MFDNIGGKIKGLAKAVMWIGILVSFGIAVCVFSVAVESESVVGIFLSIGIVAVGSWLASVASYLLYGFGQLVENSDISAGRMTLEEAERQYTEKETQRAVATADGYIADEQAEDETAPLYRESTEFAERLEQLEIELAKGKIDRVTYERERELILKQAEWYGE